VSADNILIIFEHKGKVRVHDFNFSDISSHPSWDFPLTEAKIADLTQYICASRFDHEIHKCETFEQAEGFCKRHMRANVVEYDYTSLRVKVDVDVADGAVRKASKDRKRKLQLAKAARATR
jgi:hypothetical protein